MKKYLFVSIKPEYADKIIKGEKRIELRKIRPHVTIGDYIIIYASSPVKSVLGFGVIKQIIEESPNTIWEKHAISLGIDKKRFDEYYAGKERAIGIEIHEINSIEPISLAKLRQIAPDFHPPQVYRYVSNYNINRTILKFL